jgi:hypothetical protein
VHRVATGAPLAGVAGGPSSGQHGGVGMAAADFISSGGSVPPPRVGSYPQLVGVQNPLQQQQQQQLSSRGDAAAAVGCPVSASSIVDGVYSELGLARCSGAGDATGASSGQAAAATAGKSRH